MGKSQREMSILCMHHAIRIEQSWIHKNIPTRLGCDVIEMDIAQLVDLYRK